MIRREFLRLVVALGGMSMAQRDRLVESVASVAKLNPNLLDHLEVVTYDLAARWDSENPVALHRALLGHYAALGALADAQGPGLNRRRGQQLAAHAAAVLGLACRFVGNDLDASNYLAIADLRAHEAGDTHLRALALVWNADIFSAVQRGEGGPSPAEVQPLMFRAEQCADPTAPPALRALVLLRQAEEHAAAGAVTAAARYLDSADTALTRVTFRDPEFLYGLGWNPTINRAFRGNVALLSGRPAEAVPILQDVLNEYPAGSVVSNRAAAMTDLASAHARLGEVEPACELLTAAWKMATTSRLTDRQRRVKGVRNRDLEPFRTAREVVRLDDLLRTYW